MIEQPDSSPRFHDSGDSEDAEDLKDVYCLDFETLPGETSTAFQLRYVFACEGYIIKHIEEVPAPPVIIVRAIRKTAPKINDDKLFVGHIRDILRRAGFRLKKDELTVGDERGRILVAFLSGKPQVDFQEILLEPQED